MNPPNVYGALVSYTQTQTGVETYYDREPEQTDITARALPYIVISGPLTIKYNFENTFTAEGELTFACYAVGDDGAADMGQQVMDLYGPSETWQQNIPIDPRFKMIESSPAGQDLKEEEATDREGNPVFNFELRFNVIVSGGY